MGFEIVLLVGALLGSIFPISGPVSTVMMVVIAVIGAGIIWQGTKNLNRDS